MKSTDRSRRINFTKKNIEALAVVDDRFTVYDTQTRGLGVFIQPTKKTFFWFRRVRNYPRRITIGLFPDLTVEQARLHAAEHNAKLARWRADKWIGDDPFARQGSLTLETLLDEYVEKHVKAHAANPERAVPETKSYGDYFPSLKGRHLGSIRPSDIRTLHENIGEKHGHVMANRISDFLKRLYNWAIATERWSGQNPCENIIKYHEDQRTRFLKPDEMPILFKQLKDEPADSDLRDFVLLALTTGARKSDILSMRWENLSMDGLGAKRWQVPRPKNRKPYNVALTPEAIQVLKERWARRKSDTWVFPTTKPKSKCPHLRSLKRSWRRLREKAGLTDVWFHDLRRTLGSWQAARGTSLKIIGASLGHSSQRSTDIYSQLQLDPVLESVQGATKAMMIAAKKKPKKLLKASNA